MSADDVSRLREERSGEDWSARSARNGGTEIADPLAVSRARALVSAVPEEGPASLATATVGDLLDGLGLLKRGALTNAGWLMIGQRPDSAAPSIVYQHGPSHGGEPDRVVRLTDPLVVAVDRLMALRH